MYDHTDDLSAMGRAPGGRGRQGGGQRFLEKNEKSNFFKNAGKYLPDHARPREWVQTGSQTGPNQGESNGRGGTGMQIYGTMRNREGQKGLLEQTSLSWGILTQFQKFPPKKKVCELGD